MLRHRTRGRIWARLRSQLREQLLEGFRGDANFAAERVVELHDQGADDDDRGGETGEQHEMHPQDRLRAVCSPEHVTVDQATVGLQ